MLYTWFIFEPFEYVATHTDLGSISMGFLPSFFRCQFEGKRVEASKNCHTMFSQAITYARFSEVPPFTKTSVSKFNSIWT